MVQKKKSLIPHALIPDLASGQPHAAYATAPNPEVEIGPWWSMG